MLIIDNGEKDRNISEACRLISQYFKSLVKYYLRSKTGGTVGPTPTPSQYSDSVPIPDSYDENDLDDILGIKTPQQSPKWTQSLPGSCSMATSGSVNYLQIYYTPHMTAGSYQASSPLTASRLTATQIQQQHYQMKQALESQLQAAEQQLGRRAKKEKTLDEILGLHENNEENNKGDSGNESGL